MGKTTAKNIRLLLLDDHALFRESVARLLQAESGFEVVADCSSGTEALRIIKSREIDLVLLDLDLGEERGADFLESLRAEHFKGKVLIVTAGVNEREIPTLIRTSGVTQIRPCRVS
jgi:two-component system nitrate/nitrite response regulator NarL